MNHLPFSRPIRLVLAVSAISMTMAGCTTTHEAIDLSGNAACIVINSGIWSGTAPDSSGLPGSIRMSYVMDCRIRSSDDRTSGRSQPTVRCDFTVDDHATIGACWGTDTLTNAQGTWEGTLTGIANWSASEPGLKHTFDLTYLGTGDYEGLQYEMTLTGSDSTWTSTGRIEPQAA